MQIHSTPSVDFVPSGFDSGEACPAFGDLERASLERAGSERAAHRRRVAELCRRTARKLDMPGTGSLALVLAAAEHSDGIREVRRSFCPNRSAIHSHSFESFVAEKANQILRCRDRIPDARLDGETELAAAILEACDQFDDAVELAVLDCDPIPRAINKFFSDSRSRLQRRVLDALRCVTAPLSGTGLRPFLASEMPPISSAVSKLMRVSNSTPFAELESIAASDPVLVQRMTRDLARSGVPFARRILLVECFERILMTHDGAFWEHAKSVAACAQHLAAECGYDRGIAFVAGMLHDVGRLVTRRYPLAARVEEDSLRAAGFPLTYAECLIYGVDHATLGSLLLRRWNLPSEIADAVEFHHRPENTKSVLAGILTLAEDAVSGADIPSEAPWPAMRRAAGARLTGIYRDSPPRSAEKAADKSGSLPLAS